LLAFAFASSASGRVAAETLIHAGDKVRVTVYNHPDLSVETVVTGNGEVVVPIGGNVSVEGLNPAVAGVKIGLALQPAVRRPTVDVRVIEQIPSIFFTGSQLGVQPYQPGETLTAALGSISAKGSASLSLSAIDLRDVRIERDGKTIGTYDLQALARAGDAGPRLQSGDIIAVANKPLRVDVGGIVKSPGPVYLYPGDILGQAVEEAGGFTPNASLTNIVLRRDGAEQIVSAAGPALTAPAHDGDALTVQPAPHVNVFGMVTSSGNYVLQGNTSLLAALYSAGGPNKWADFRRIKIVRAGVTTEHDVMGLAHGNLSGNVALADGDVVFVPEGHRIDPLPFLEALGAFTNLKYLLK
jgi:polysaccharide export outer membrane protein